MKIIPALSLPIYEEVIPKCQSIYKYFFDTKLHIWSGSSLKWESQESTQIQDEVKNYYPIHNFVH
jgi:hypothetical protein